MARGYPAEGVRREEWRGNFSKAFAGLAQLGEHHVYTVEVGGSNPSARTIEAITFID